MNKLKSFAIEFNITLKSFQAISLDDCVSKIREAGENRDKMYWIHGFTHELAQLQQLMQSLDLSLDILSLCKKKETIPKLLEHEKSLTMRFQALHSPDIHHKQQIKFENLVFHLSTTWCLTLSDNAFSALNNLMESYQRIITYAKTPCSILFVFIDNIVNDYSMALYHFELAVEKMDFKKQNSDPQFYEKIIATKKQVMKMKRYIVMLRNILMRISGRKIAVISESCRLSLTSLYEHSIMTVAEVEAIKDSLNGFLAQIDNALMFKMSESMAVLTAFAAIFLPLTLVSSIYGMNFHWIPELSWKYGYFLSLTIMALIALSLVIFFKKKKWF